MVGVGRSLVNFSVSKVFGLRFRLFCTPLDCAGWLGYWLVQTPIMHAFSRDHQVFH